MDGQKLARLEGEHFREMDSRVKGPEGAYTWPIQPTKEGGKIEYREGLM